jgi:hypothetical protein
MSHMTSRSGATMHVQQNHIIQRRCAREAIGSSPLVLQWDEGSKRKKAWVVAAVVGSRERGDGSRLREVLGAKHLAVRLRRARGARGCRGSATSKSLK